MRIQRHGIGQTPAGVFNIVVIGDTIHVGLTAAVYGLTAEQQARTEAEAITEFLEDMLDSPDPEREGKDVRVVDMLERGADTADTRFADQPLVAARLHHVIGRTYRVLGVYDSAEVHLARALASRRALLGDADLATAESIFEFGLLQRERGHFEHVVEGDDDLYWADRTEAGRRRQLIRGRRIAESVGLRAGERALDLGCGTGAYTAPIAQGSPGSFVGVDVAPALLRVARERTGANVVLLAVAVARVRASSSSTALRSQRA